MEIINRIQSPTPDFFQKAKKYALVLIAVAIALIAADKTGMLDLPDIIGTICTYLIVIGGAVFGTAQTAKR
ncbi:hypothetical protein LCGC14_1751580 [marine sediment metagenome]|uniref:Uncharacterized protein n=1 Tax=marine sediment metagenome TaxID=412755 RepID=A0A0F9JIT2_9ZZZZ